MTEKTYTVLTGVAVVAIIVIIFTFAFVQPYFEMKTFNKFSETKATYWEAFFSNLRVIPDSDK